MNTTLPSISNTEISIIAPPYNVACYIEEFLLSITRQSSFNPYEMLVAIEGSGGLFSIGKYKCN